MGAKKYTLKPCPFCGSKRVELTIAREGKDGWRDYYCALCNYDDGGCGANGGWRHTQAEAIDAWNERAEMPKL